MATYTGNSQIVSANTIKKLQQNTAVNTVGTFSNPYVSVPSGQFARVIVRYFEHNIFDTNPLYIGTADSTSRFDGTTRLTDDPSLAFQSGERLQSKQNEVFTMYENERLFSTTGSSPSATSHSIILEVEFFNNP